MIIREILELSMEKPINEIAKEHLNIGEKLTREALKKAGCYTKPGKKGWFFDGNEEILNQSIYDFNENKTPTKKTTQVTTKPTKNEQTQVTKKERIIIRKRFSVDLDIDLIKQLKVKSVIEDRNLYELVEIALKDFLKK